VSHVLEVFEFVAVGVAVSIAVCAASASAHRRSVASRALDRYAQSRGLVFVPAPSVPRGASPRVLGAKDGVSFSVELYRLGGELRTRVSASVVRRAPVLSVLQRRAFPTRKPAVLQSGDDTFDQAYVVTAGTAEDAQGLCDIARALLLLDARREGVWLSSNGRNVTISWSGIESDPIVLDVARDAAVLVGGWHRPDSAYR
jgi:hypothetical protein